MNQNKVLLQTFGLIILSSVLSAQALNVLLYDKEYSMSVGAENVLTLHKLSVELEHKILRPKLFEENTRLRKTAGISYRIAKTFLIDHAIDHWTLMLQHEVFGHGSRYRELGFEDNSYEFNALWPYGNVRRQTNSVHLI